MIWFMHGPFSISAALTFDTNDPDAFAMDAYDGGLLRVGGYDAPVVVDLAGLRTAPQVKACYEHKQVVGHQEAVEISATGIKTKGRLSVDTEETQTIRAAQKSGFKWDASVLVVPDQGKVEQVARGAVVRVNGRQITGPAYIARSGELREVSFVGVGGGSGTRAVVLAASMSSEGIEMSEQVETPAADKATEDQGAVIAALNARLEAQAAETERLTRENRGNTFNALVSKYRVGTLPQDIAASMDTTITNLRQNFIDGKVTPEAAELALIKASLPKEREFTPWQGAVHSKTPELNANAIEASLLKQNGWSEAELAKHFKPNDIEAALSSDYRGASIGSVMDAVIGQRRIALSDRKSNDFIRAGLHAEREIAASGFSTVSLTGILGNVANKSMLKGYSGVNATWSQIAAVTSVNDFKTNTAYRLDMTGSYKKVGSDGQLKHIGVSEASATIAADTYGAMIALTRQMIINDDLGAFAELPMGLGRIAALRIEEAVYVTLLANTDNFFASGNGNYFEGAATNLQTSSLTTAKQKFLDFVSDNKPVLVTPKKLLVGTALADTADVLMAERSLVGGSSTVVNRNPHAGTLQVVVSPYLNNTSIKTQDGAAISGQSSTVWFMLADPADRAVVRVAFLRGNQTPTIESADTDFNTLGIQWRSYHDFGVGQGEKTGGVMSKGTT